MFCCHEVQSRVANLLTMISGRSKGPSLPADSLAAVVFNRVPCLIPCRYTDYYGCRDPFVIRLHSVEGQDIDKMGTGSTFEP